MDFHRLLDWGVDSCFWILRKLLGPVVRLIWIREARGLHHIPRHGAAIVAFNHQSYFDFFCFLAVSRRNVHFLAAEKFFEHALWRALMRATGQIHVKRRAKDKREVHDKVFEHLSRGRVIGIFPEGTRSHEREHMQRAFSGVAKYAIKGHVPVIPVGIKGTYDILSRHDRRVRLKKVAELHVGAPLHLERYRKHKMNARAYHIITEDIMVAITHLCGKNYRYAPQWKFNHTTS
jgi:1-acyl-sn-glycerol-3-phosphate acyltransferase